MSESESIATRTPQVVASRNEADDLLPDLAARAIPEREGLPRSYRMRADAHYVEQLEAPAQPVIRMVKLPQIDCRELPAPDRVEALTRSVGIHGVLHPLLVKRQGGRYSLIAGRKRLAAAIAAGLTTVPCLLHDAEGAAAAALAAADNLRTEDEPGASNGERAALHPVLEAVTADLTTIRTSVALLRSARTGGLSHKVGADLIESQAARAEWLITSVLGTFENTRPSPVAAIVQRVSDGFRGLAGLTAIDLECTVSPAAAVWKLPEDPAAAAIQGAIFAALSWLDGLPRPRIELHADVAHTRTLRIEVVQRSARVPPDLGEADQELTRPSAMISVLAVRLARTVAALQGGGAELTPLPGVGSVLQITFAAGRDA